MASNACRPPCAYDRHVRQRQGGPLIKDTIKSNIETTEDPWNASIGVVDFTRRDDTLMTQIKCLTRMQQRSEQGVLVALCRFPSLPLNRSFCY